MLNFITLYMYSVEEVDVWGAGLLPPPQCSVHGGEEGAMEGSPPPPAILLRRVLGLCVSPTLTIVSPGHEHILQAAVGLVHPTLGAGGQS